MSLRRRIRESAMQALFFMDVNHRISHDMLMPFLEVYPVEEKMTPFFTVLVEGVIQHRQLLDKIIEKFSSNWKVSRMACVDRNVLRIAAYELIFCPDIPPKVSINEAIEIGKIYGSDESGAFINGILDSIHIAMENGENLTQIEATTGSK